MLAEKTLGPSGRLNEPKENDPDEAYSIFSRSVLHLTGIHTGPVRSTQNHPRKLVNQVNVDRERALTERARENGHPLPRRTTADVDTNVHERRRARKREVLSGKSSTPTATLASGLGRFDFAIFGRG